MTDRINAIVVVLEQDVRVDDAEHLLNAIRMLKGVASVEGNVASIDDHIAYVKARQALIKPLSDLVHQLAVETYLG